MSKISVRRGLPTISLYWRTIVHGLWRVAAYYTEVMRGFRLPRRLNGVTKNRMVFLKTSTVIATIQRNCFCPNVGASAAAWRGNSRRIFGVARTWEGRFRMTGEKK